MHAKVQNLPHSAYMEARCGKWCAPCALCIDLRIFSSSKDPNTHTHIGFMCGWFGTCIYALCSGGIRRVSVLSGISIYYILYIYGDLIEFE